MWTLMITFTPAAWKSSLLTHSPTRVTPLKLWPLGLLGSSSTPRANYSCKQYSKMRTWHFTRYQPCKWSLSFSIWSIKMFCWRNCCQSSWFNHCYFKRTFTHSNSIITGSVTLTSKRMESLFILTWRVWLLSRSLLSLCSLPTQWWLVS